MGILLQAESKPIHLSSASNQIEALRSEIEHAKTMIGFMVEHVGSYRAQCDMWIQRIEALSREIAALEIRRSLSGAGILA